ncbi:DUF2958 domain-containing protein (plasmid) [Sphingomonas paeninsulae]|uniref:DUF2958 domain-containing protein n=1 Tax=Sphingomonas paeninsulae TaxID=2319844 RepID=A0A494TBQ3_SPHPE|nr:DUF2958 domain-containing protein [Sphingomonas paeninsulae]AYJ84842.1 DUF2958 domain-containing protein [Sphingomonas paeninsulae]
MKLLTPALAFDLRMNGAAAARGAPGHDPAPLAKLFNPMGAATWLVTELDADGDTLFGLADLGFGCPEMGSFSLSEIEGTRLPFGLCIERDLFFTSTEPLSVWADSARRAGSIMGAAALLADASRAVP